MIIVTSAAYISPELITEFGKLPPCMLPLQNKRLFQHQLELFPDDEQVVYSLPNNYVLTKRDEALFKQHNVDIVKVPQNLSLGESLVYTLNVMGRYLEPVKILHGDTLFKEIPKGVDLCLVSDEQINYNWAHISNDDNSKVYCGYFSCSNQSLLIKKITENKYQFIEGFEAYRNEVKINEIEANFWLDFGLVNSYYRSKSSMTTQRVFNDLKISQYSVKKSSTDKVKMRAEAMWFKNMPVTLKQYIPSLWDYGIEGEKGYYEIEYFYLITLSDLYVFGNQPLFVWKNVLNACANFIDNCMASGALVNSAISIHNNKIYGDKTFTRLKTYAISEKINLDQPWILNGIELPSLNEIVVEMNEAIPFMENKYLSIIHGDFCFSNILYNYKTQSVKVIDPRGLDLDGNETIYGDVRYDVAKLAHSVIGLYDYIISGCFDFEEVEKYNYNFEIQIEHHVLQIQQYFKSLNFGDIDLKQLSTYPILVHLFLSMLPLHNDHPHRQKAMLANALRLYTEYKSII